MRSAPGAWPHRPARTVVPVGALHYGYLVEITATGALREP
jgi:enamine deaminase RidA (YjgF/YER057c/UK114 family)